MVGRPRRPFNSRDHTRRPEPPDRRRCTARRRGRWTISFRNSPAANCSLNISAGESGLQSRLTDSRYEFRGRRLLDLNISPIHPTPKRPCCDQRTLAKDNVTLVVNEFMIAEIQLARTINDVRRVRRDAKDHALIWIVDRFGADDPQMRRLASALEV